MAKLLVALVALLASAPAPADERLWSLLKAGGQVVLIRHTVTTPGAGDPPGMRLDDCSTQRNLTDAGRAHARRIGEAFKSRGILMRSATCLAAPRTGSGKSSRYKHLWPPRRRRAT
jgi:hypothetical protein